MNITINDLVSKKEALMDAIKEIMIRYVLHKIYSLDTGDKRELQEKLYEIPNWSERKREKEFARFLKYIYKKSRFSESDLNSMISDVVFLNIKMLTKSPIEITAPDTRTFWYKLMNLTGRYFYNKIKHKIKIIDKESDTIYIDNLIDTLFQKYIPLNDIIDIIEAEKLSYHFEDTDPDQEIDEQKIEYPNPIELKFISPDHFYFKPQVVHDQSSDDNSTRKEIHIKPKLNLL